MPKGIAQPSWNFRPSAPSWRPTDIVYCLFYCYCYCCVGRVFSRSNSTIVLFWSSHQYRLVVCIVILIKILSDVLNHVFLATRNGKNPKEKSIGELTLIAFYFLLRVGEYTYHGTGKRRTQQFCLGDIKFFTKNTMVPVEQLQKYATQITLVSMTIDNQKNGQHGQTLSHHAIITDNGCCPVQALVSRITDMIAMGAMADTVICSFKCQINGMAICSQHRYC